MSLTKINRRRCPIDGTAFATMANLNSLLRGLSHFDDNMEWPKECENVKVPCIVRMEKYKAQETRQRPDGMIYGPVVRIGSIESPEFPMFGHHWQVNLFNDYRLDPSGDNDDKWLYYPIDGDLHTPGEDVSVYRCDKCNEQLYRDDDSRRQHYSACLFDGSLVCRDCDVTGLVADGEAQDQIARCIRLGNYLADKYDSEAGRKFNDNIAHLGHGFCWTKPSQTRIFREDKFSFAWGVSMFMEDGTKKHGMNGGLIQHGPCPIEEGDGYRFRTWDYGLKVERDANDTEIAGINWSIHT